MKNEPTPKAEKTLLDFTKENYKSLAPLAPDEKLVFESYFNSLKSKDSVDLLGINTVYRNAVPDMKISQISKNRILSFLEFHYDIMAYFDFQNLSASRGCVDWCMYKKLLQLKHANWIDQAVFISSAAYSTAQMVGSCAWDCW